ncbi:DUF1648 domain-containing protein [Alkalinema pantanalense CENA528]|uniref:DUF1648 domain-containing protein n=1 Tax=Alkalinema pantanalense TaxID=1620705 RepID=UPI003D6FB9A1
MKKNLPITLFVIAELSVLTFILTTASSLPAVVASHFDAAGVPNGYMSRTFYLWFMLGFTVMIPSIVAASLVFVDRIPAQYINLPNKQIWLSEPYRKSTFAYLKAHGLGMGALIAGFMGYVHWLVIQANRAVPAQLSSGAIIGGLVVFVGAAIGWSILLPLKFMQLPKTR